MDEITKKVLEFYDSLFIGYELLNPDESRGYIDAIEHAVKEYEEILRENDKLEKKKKKDE